MDLRRSKSIQQNLHTRPASAAHLQNPAAVDPPAEALQQVSHVPPLHGSTGRVIHGRSTEPVELHAALPLRSTTVEPLWPDGTSRDTTRRSKKSPEDYGS